jgi:hypothetical protein
MGVYLVYIDRGKSMIDRIDTDSRVVFPDVCLFVGSPVLSLGLQHGQIFSTQATRSPRWIFARLPVQLVSRRQTLQTVEPRTSVVCTVQHVGGEPETSGRSSPEIRSNITKLG